MTAEAAIRTALSLTRELRDQYPASHLRSRLNAIADRLDVALSKVTPEAKEVRNRRLTVILAEFQRKVYDQGFEDGVASVRGSAKTDAHQGFG